MTSPTIEISPQQAAPAPRARGRFIALAVLCLAELVGVMDKMGIGPTAKTVKSAQIVGEVMGKYHPH
ncbi:MAG: hypothetical protein ACFN3I_07800, partial [Arachnia propionica]